ncbi:MAG TPA: carbamoylphosphate synthase large subunit short form, partial [Verrucomicrobiae bacterium]|nr:carbamoylphosphate synthase large subunit short form [Verrucomicrobiae bacterium]
MKQNVLVFPCGSEIGLEIYKSLSHSTHFNIFGGSSTADHGEFVYENYIGDLPTVDSPTFTEELNSVIDKYD